MKSITLSTRGRSWRAMLAIIGSIFYAASFFVWKPMPNIHYLAHDQPLSSIACTLSAAAGTAWPILGILLVLRGNQPVRRWMDICLGTMCMGMPFLLIGAFLNLLPWLDGMMLSKIPPLLFIQVMLLIGSEVGMAVVFIRLTEPILKTRVAINFWLVHNSVFAALFLLFLLFRSFP